MADGRERPLVRRHLDSLVAGCGACLQETPDRGLGLFCERVPEGEPAVLFGDAPLGGLLQRRFREKGGLACGLCGHALGSLRRHLQVLAGNKDLPPDGGDPELDEGLSDLVPGRPLFSLKRPVFCSEACLERHERLFGRLRKQRAACRKFAEHAERCGCPFYLLALKLICWAASEASASSSSSASGDDGGERAAAPLNALFSRPYWDAVDLPAGEAERAAFQARLRGEVAASLALAREALGGLEPLPERLRPFLELDGYAGLLGALCCNAIAVVYVSPLVQHILQVDAMVDGQERRAAIGALQPWIALLREGREKGAANGAAESGSDEETPARRADDEKVLDWPGGPAFSTALFPPFRGYAVYPLLALLNHSCRPTCAVEFTFTGSLFVLAQKEGVLPGQELTISYMDASLGSTASTSPAAVAKRRRLLQPYGFDCGCEACAGATGGAAPRPKKRRKKAAA